MKQLTLNISGGMIGDKLTEAINIAYKTVYDVDFTFNGANVLVKPSYARDTISEYREQYLDRVSSTINLNLTHISEDNVKETIVLN